MSEPEEDWHIAWKVLRMLLCMSGPVKDIREKSLKISSSESNKETCSRAASSVVVDMARCIIVSATCSRKVGDNKL